MTHEPPGRSARPRSRWPARLAGAVALALVGGVAHGQESPPVLVGINVVNPQWRPRAEQDATLDAVSRAGVRTIRVPFVPPSGGTYDDAAEYVRRAAGRGLAVILIVYPAFPDGTPERPKVADQPEMWSLPALSAADPETLVRTYGPALRRLDSQGVVLAGIEFGNEINWAAFNGTFPVPGRGIVFGADDLDRTPLGRRLTEGFRAYLASLAALKRLRDGLTANRRTPLLAAGFADFGPAGARTGQEADAVNVGATLRFLRVHGLDALVDGYSIHVYPDADATPAERRTRLARDVLAECGPTMGIGKPCWLTEWGVPVSTPCGLDDAPRAALTAEFRAALAPAAREGRVRALVYYAWGGEGDDAHALTRCGALRSGGRAALAPFVP